MKKLFRAVCVALSVIAVFSMAACKEDEQANTGNVNVYTEGDTFEFAKWQGQDLVYTVSETENGTHAEYTKLMSDSGDLAMIATISCDRPFAYVNFEVSGTADKEVIVSVGDSVIALGTIGEQHFFLTETKTIYTFKFTNKLALVGATDVYMNVDPGNTGLEAKGSIDIYRSWFSDEIPEGAVYEDPSTLRQYTFAQGSSWSRCNGWFLDTSWTRMKITPSSGSGVHVVTTGNDQAKEFASIIYPIEPNETTTTLTIEMRDEDDTVSNIAILLRGGQRSWNEAGQYWDYYEAGLTYYGAEDLVKDEDGRFTITFDLSESVKAIGENVDDDGLMIVMFVEDHTGHPEYASGDRKFDFVIESTTFD